MRNLFIVLLVIIGFTSCSIEKNLPIISTKFDSQKIYTFDGCSSFSYISTINDEKYGKLFLEYIDLDLSCTWTGFSRGYFDDLFKETLKLKSLKTIERIDYKNYEFNTYLINDKYYMNVIYEYSVKEDTFIIDYDGKYFTDEIKKINPYYVNKYLDKPRFSSNYHNSLVDMNMIKGYFARENEIFNFEK